MKQLNEYNTSRSIEDNRKLLQTLETTRNFQLWHDASVIANHGHIVMTVNELYDEAIFYNSEEYYEISNEKLNIQSIIEEPYLYIIGRCRANDEQIMYVETRLECLRMLDKRIDLTNWAIISDKMCMFHGDGPASQFEIGNSKGGDYFCCCCDVPSFYMHDFVRCGYAEYVTL